MNLTIGKIIILDYPNKNQLSFKIKAPLAHSLGAFFNVWRRNRDSNPSSRLRDYELSKPAPSATWVFLRVSPFQASEIIGVSSSLRNVIFARLIRIMKETVVSRLNAGQKAEKFVKKYLPDAPLGFIYKAFRKKDIKANGHWIKKDYILQEGDVIRIYVTDQQLEDFKKPRPAEKKPLEYPIAYEDDEVLIIDKPKGLLVYGDKTGVRETLGNAVLDYLYLKGDYDPNDNTFVPSPAHRLDRNTSGLICYGKTDRALKDLTDLFKERTQIDKYYVALVVGDVEKDGFIDKPLKKDIQTGRVSVCPLAKGGKAAKTEYHVLQRFGSYTLLELHLLTGRTHQLRVHLASIGHPIVGDEKYGDFQDCRKAKRLCGITSQLLHAEKLCFGDVSGALKGLAHCQITSPIPSFFEDAIEILTHNPF